MARVVLLWDHDCPHVGLAQSNLAAALDQAGLQTGWQEFCLSDPSIPEIYRGFGSPTVLIDDADVAGSGPAGAPSCRLYEGNAGAPSTELIVQRLLESIPAGVKKPLTL